MTKLPVLLPFSGFCDSLHSYVLEACLDCDIEYLESDCGCTPEQVEALFDGIDWRVAFEAYAREYADSLLSGIFELPEPAWEYGELVSPREYNFSHDRIFVRIEVAALSEIRAAVNPGTLARLVEELYTGYDGFHSFYSPELADWPAELAEWAECQLGTLLLAWLADRGQERLAPDDVFERSDEVASRCYLEAWSHELENMWGSLTAGKEA